MKRILFIISAAAMLFVGCQKAAPVKVDVTKVTLDKTEAGVMIDGTVTLTASVEPVNAWIQDIVWTSDNEAVATVDEAGKVTGIAKGTATVKAVAKDKESVFATCTVTVTDKPIRVSGLELNKVKSELYVGDKDTLVVTVLPAIATDQSVVWKSSDETVAVVDSGRVVALAEGSAKITVRSIDGDKTASCNVEVYKKEVTLTAPAKLTVCVDSTASIGATVDPDSLKILYRSDRPFIKVDSLGNVVANQPGEGTITLTVEDTDEFEGDETVVKVTVEPVFAIDETNSSIVVNGVYNVGQVASGGEVVFKSWADWTVSADDFITILDDNDEPITGGEAGTVSIWVVVENNQTNVGRTGTITFTAANGEPLGAIQVNQEMFLGTYAYYDTRGNENYLSVIRVGDDSPYGNYKISGLGIPDGSYWRADFDAENNVLVCKGYEFGGESYGVQFNMSYGLYSPAYGWFYGYYCYPDENRSAYKKTLEFDIDPATGALTSFAEDCTLVVEVYDTEDTYIGDMNKILPGTELMPYNPEPAAKTISAAPAAKASLKADPVMVGRKGVKGPRLK